MPGVDIIRFCAATLVMMYHLGAETWANHDNLAASIVGGRAAFPELFGATWTGFVGVEIFFVISGLVIAYSAADATPIQFLRSRILRLYPAAWICATLTTAVTWATDVERPSAIARGYIHSLLLYPFHPWADPVYWTLGVEMAFYGLVFLLIVFKAHRRIATAGIVMGAASACYWIVGTALMPSFLMDHLWDRRLDLSLISYGVYFSGGILLYCVRQTGFSAFRLFFSILLLVAAFIEIRYKTAQNDLDFHSAEPSWEPIAVFMLAMAASALSLFWTTSRSAARALRAIGVATYPLYLIHDQCGAAVMRFLLDLGTNRFVSLGLAALLCIAFSLACALMLEPPIRRVLRKPFDWAAAAWPSNRHQEVAQIAREE
jgi:peptidoglycan/LPS O-acetylase OafA/YrhL